MTIRRMRIACWITKATNKHSQYALLIAFPQQQWLQERASLLRYTYISCIVIFSANSMAAIYLLQKVLKFLEEPPFAMLFNRVFTLTEYCTI